jgi:nicotinamide phosphoribosyltransferase
MTARGREGEMDVVDQLLDEYTEGILSVVADSYNVYNFVDQLGTRFRERVLAREGGPFVVRPDSITDQDRTPESLVVTLSHSLWHYFGGETNAKGYRVLNPAVRILWGDGINPDGIEKILGRAAEAGFSAENYVFGMGGGLLQKVNRDTQRFAFKASAIKRNGEWHDVQKQPLDASKASKKGRLKLTRDLEGDYATESINEPVFSHVDVDDVLQTVFEDGELKNELTFDEVRKNAKNG